MDGWILNSGLVCKISSGFVLETLSWAGAPRQIHPFVPCLQMLTCCLLCQKHPRGLVLRNVQMLRRTVVSLKNGHKYPNTVRCSNVISNNGLFCVLECPLVRNIPWFDTCRCWCGLLPRSHLAELSCHHNPFLFPTWKFQHTHAIWTWYDTYRRNADIIHIKCTNLWYPWFTETLMSKCPSGNRAAT